MPCGKISFEAVGEREAMDKKRIKIFICMLFVNKKLVKFICLITFLKSFIKLVIA
jgi:hypothetical protein